MYQKPYDSIILSYNKRAMEYLRNEDYKSALTYLTKAEEILTSSPIKSRNKLYGITLNNFGCFYKRVGKPGLALNFLKKALEIETNSPVDINNLAGTHLNICAILSQIDDHSNALVHALKSLGLLKNKYLEDPSTLTTLLVAHHNAGVEYEFLGQFNDAFNVYYKGWILAQENFGDEHAMTKSLKSSLKNANFARKNISNDPIRDSPMTPNNKKRASAPRSYRNSSNISAKIIEKDPEKSESIRFITGERLRPMFKREKITVKKRKQYDTKALIKELNGDTKNVKEEYGKKYAERQKREEKNFFHEMNESFDLKESSNSKTNNFSNSVSLESYNQDDLSSKKTNMATQVDFFHANGLKSMRNKAAIVIQKHCRGFLSKKKYEILKYTKKLKDAENQAKVAEEKLKSLRKSPKKETVLPGPAPVPAELVPIAYKDKLSESRRSLEKMPSILSKKPSLLSAIPEEKEGYYYKLISIQSHVRGWAVRKEFVLKRNAIVTIQKNIKRYLVRKLFLQIKEAIIFIQRFWRMWRKKLRRNKQKKITGKNHRKN